MPEVAKITVEVAGGTATLLAEPPTFKTGSRGFYGQGRSRALTGRRYQVSVNIVEIDSKPQSSS